VPYRYPPGAEVFLPAPTLPVPTLPALALFANFRFGEIALCVTAVAGLVHPDPGNSPQPEGRWRQFFLSSRGDGTGEALR